MTLTRYMLLIAVLAALAAVGLLLLSGCATDRYGITEVVTIHVADQTTNRNEASKAVQVAPVEKR